MRKLKSIKLFTLKGVTNYLHPSIWFMIIGFPAYLTYSYREEPVSTMVMVAIVSLIVYLSLLFMIFIHEYSHILMAKRYNAISDRIYYNIFGAVAVFDDSIKKLKPLQEFKVVIVGPLSNFILASIFYLLYLYFNTKIETPIIQLFSSYVKLLFQMNLFIGFFNFLPIYPMDGGRMVRTLLTHFTKNEEKSFYISLYTTYVVLVGSFIYGVYDWNNVILSILCVFLLLVNYTEHQEMKLKKTNIN